MKLKRILALLLACALALGLSGCTNQEAALQTASDAIVETVQFAQSDDIHIRDKDLLYANQDRSEVVTMYLTVSRGNSSENTDHSWEEINSYSVYDYDRMGVERYKVAGLLQVGDENGPLPGELGYNQISPNCTVQIRGQSSSRNAQKNYKIRLKDNKGTWNDQQTIALNKHMTDGMRFKNKLCFDLLSEIEELMSLRTTFVHLYVRDLTSDKDAGFEDYGLYTQVEQLNKTALEAHGLDKNGHLYKVNECEFYRYEDEIMLKSDPDYDQAAFEYRLEIKGEDDHQKLIDLLERINDYSIPIESILEENFDIENIVYWMAFHILMGNVDTQNRNFYLYSPLNSQRWYILNWDCDGSLSKKQHEIQGRTDFTAWETGVSNYWGNILFQRCLKSEFFRTELDKAIEELRLFLSEEKLRSMTDVYADVVYPYLYCAPDLYYAPLTQEDYEIVLQALIKEPQLNYQLYKESLKKPLPFYIGIPEKTESGYSLLWDASYDFNNETIRYTLELARDFYYEDMVYTQDDILIPSAALPPLEPGQYFVRLTATNESGLSQYAFDYYIAEFGKVYGTRCFYVAEDGSITEDIYVEG